MIDFMLFGGFAFGQTDGWTFGVVESLSRLKILQDIAVKFFLEIGNAIYKHNSML